ncbi:MAG: radical SAM protein [Deltaproteobacteria bacterium]|nr:radical SAM protein [Deltaproteobacteria bacterium]
MTAPPRPLICVWEITLACTCRCTHCGSSAGDPRERELTTAEALDLIDALSALKCRTVTLSGGEPLLRSDWPELARRITGSGMDAELMTNGLAVLDQADAIADAGFRGVSFSVDGPAAVHDRLRRSPGGLDRLLEGAAELHRRGVRTGAVTQVGRFNLHLLEETHALVVESGFEGWLVQLTLPHGRAASELCLTPAQLPELEQTLVRLADRGQILVQTADTIGYMSRSEPRLRRSGHGRLGVWGGCQAGLRALGITSDGTVRGCLSMPPAFDEGNVRERTLEDIWNDPGAFSYNRAFDPHDLQDACGGCSLASICRAGCTGLAWASTGATTSNPYCLMAVEQRRAN